MREVFHCSLVRTPPAFFFLISLLIFAADQATKFLAKSFLFPFRTITVLPFFNIVYVENTGSAFGMFKSLGNVFFIGFSILAAGAVTYFIIREKEHRLALSFILGGALGNLADRILHGAVIDFLDFHWGRHHWPAFNVADSALTIGITLVMAGTFLALRKSSKSTQTT